MIGYGIMAIFAGIVDTTAPHPDGDDVERRIVVNAARLSVQPDPAHLKTSIWYLHGSHEYR
jgi:hypothetical protein